MSIVKTFVLRSSAEAPQLITEENFESCTEKQFPFVQSGKYYATCPECENPIQIRGLYSGSRVYGAHAGKSIDGLNPYNQINYEYCPRSVKGTRLPKETKKEVLTEKDITVYNTLRDYFDKVIDFAKMSFGFYITPKFAKVLLSSYCDRQRYLYPHSTVNNLPYILLYLYDAINPYGIYIRKGSDLEAAIKRQPLLKLTPIAGRDQYNRLQTASYQELSMMVWGHRFSEQEDGTLNESVNIRISSGGKGVLVNVKVNIPEHGFVRYIHSEKALMYRDPKLLKTALDLMPDITPDG